MHARTYVRVCVCVSCDTQKLMDPVRVKSEYIFIYIYIYIQLYIYTSVYTFFGVTCRYFINKNI